MLAFVSSLSFFPVLFPFTLLDHLKAISIPGTTGALWESRTWRNIAFTRPLDRKPWNCLSLQPQNQEKFPAVFRFMFALFRGQISDLTAKMDAQTDIETISDLECQLSQVSIPMEDVTPDAIREWLSAFVNSYGTASEMLLCSAQASTSVLIGPPTARIFGSNEERGNLFMVVVPPPGTGKTPACQKGCIELILKELQNKIKAYAVIDKTSTSGLFNHFLGGSTVPILCVNEAYSLLNKLTYNTKSTSQTHPSMERLCKCYDGDFWFVLKGNKGKRVGVPN